MVNANMQKKSTYEGKKYERISHEKFEYSMLRCSLFIPLIEIGSSVILRKIPDEWLTYFDGDPLTLPTPQNMPPDVDMLRLALKDTKDEKRFRLTKQRIDFELAPQIPSDIQIDIGRFYSDAIKYLVEFIDQFDIRFNRMAVNVERFAQHENPGLYLAQHFCREEWWLEKPLNRPKHFELHAHKRYEIYDNLTVNSWVRNKTSEITKTGDSIILVVQDINTLKEDIGIKKFDNRDIEKYIKNISNEMEKILSFYYPRKITD